MGSEAPTVRGPRLPLVLVIDDDRTVGIVAKRALASLRHLVEQVDTAAAAVAAVRARTPDLILLDARLAGEGGRLLGALRELGVTIPPVVMLSADGAPSAGDREVVSVLRKPFTEEELLSAVAALVAPVDAHG